LSAAEPASPPSQGILTMVEHVEGFGAKIRIFDSVTAKCFSRAISKFVAPRMRRMFLRRYPESKSGRSDKYRGCTAKVGCRAEVQVRRRSDCLRRRDKRPLSKRVGNSSVVVRNVAAALVITLKGVPAFNVCMPEPLPPPGPVTMLLPFKKGRS